MNTLELFSSDFKLIYSTYDYSTKRWLPYEIKYSLPNTNVQDQVLVLDSYGLIVQDLNRYFTYLYNNT